MWELIFLLLPLAALSGWIIGRKRMMGLQDFLGRNKDKGAELFIQWLESNQETIDTHLTLGNLFRRRGEVDKAIGIHQNLITKSSLTEEQRALFLLELSRDYMRAGVLDRAEGILLELLDKGKELEASLKHLVEIYQQSKDWLRAIEMAEQLEKQTRRPMNAQIAHYYCELAEQRWLRGEREGAKHYLGQAKDKHSNSVRLSMLLGDIESSLGNHKAAIKAYQQVAQQDKSFLSEIVFPLAKCYEAIGHPQGMVKYLDACLHTEPTLAVIVAFSDWLNKTQGVDQAVNFMVDHLRAHPSLRGIHRLIQLTLDRSHNEETKRDLALLQELIQKLAMNKPLYRCQACGFSGRTLQWQCPGCKRWDVIKPIQE